ncbi:MAG: acyl-CoA dehydrogenase family protein [Galactobacter sp.]
MPTHASLDDLLPAALLEAIRARAADHDAQNSFAHDDLEDLAATGYLKAMLPQELGGSDWGFAQAIAGQRRLAAHAPGTALAVNMHLVWTGVDRVLKALGDDRLAGMRQAVAAGERLAFGVSEPGNKAMLFDSFTTAEELDNGDFELTGVKVFTSMGPGWTRLGVFGKAGEGADARLVHGFVSRQPGVTTGSDWDALGMRASGSASTRLEKALLKAKDVHTSMAVGEKADPLIFGIFAAFLSLTGAVYAGVADRAIELAAHNLSGRTDRSTGLALASDELLRFGVADTAIDVLTLREASAALASDLDGLGSRTSPKDPSWFPRLVTFRTKAGDVAREATATALRISGGSAYTRGSEAERLFRDAAASSFHPSDAEAAHRTVADWLLGPVA